MDQYPDTIIVTVTTAATQNSSTKIWTAGTSTSYTLKCRAEVNGAARKIPGKDGSMIDYLFNCYLPKMTTVIPVDSEYVLTTLASGTISGKVKGSSNGQLNSRLWL
jgi:hypothetical protein